MSNWNSLVGGKEMQQPIVIGVVLSGLFAAPLVAYTVLWCVSRADDDSSGERPEPPAPNHPERSIPGGESDL